MESINHHSCKEIYAALSCQINSKDAEPKLDQDAMICHVKTSCYAAIFYWLYYGNLDARPGMLGVGDKRWRRIENPGKLSQ
eukprot:scaffold33877_cov17-Prasinocladus_malaysianus.AAC.1